MKKTILLKSLLLLCALIVGSNYGWAVDVLYKTQQFTTGDKGTYSAGVSAYNGSFYNTYDGFRCDYANFNNNNKGWAFVKCGGKSAYTSTIITYGKIDKAVSKVVLTIDAITVANVTSIKLYTSTNKSSWTEVAGFDKSTGAKEAIISEPTKDLYYKIELVCTKGTSNGLVTISKIQYYILPDTKYTVSYSDGGSDTESAPGDGVTLPGRSNPDGSTFVGWSETNISTATKVAPTILTGTYYPISDITLYPVYRYKATKPAKGWYEVIATDIEDGTYAICSDDYFMKASINSSRFENGAAPSITSGKLTIDPAATCIWEIYKKDGYYRIKNSTKYAGATSSKNQGALLDTEDDNHAKWTITYSGDQYVIENYGRTQDASDPTNSILRNNGENGWATYASGTGVAPRLFIKCDGALTETFYVSSIPATSATITLAAACTDGVKYYGTYSNNRAFVVPSDITVSAIKIVDGKLSYMNYSTGNVVPANTGVLVSATSSGSKSVSFSTGDVTEKSGNMLMPSGDDGITADYMAEDDVTFYRLTMHNGTDIGFWWGADSGASFALGANKSYLVVPDAVEVREGFAFDNETTGIAEVTSKKQFNGEYYNLAGQRVAQPTKGLYIGNGKKVVIK